MGTGTHVMRIDGLLSQPSGDASADAPDCTTRTNAKRLPGTIRRLAVNSASVLYPRSFTGSCPQFR
ncbi:hypothetical protein PSAB6_390117 [Paraburkholderia sabiae]|nr:hypothetical protein PSAB6_390117 [Paraburkholderia sabiae]